MTTLHAIWTNPAHFWDLLFMAGSLGGLLGILVVNVVELLIEKRRTR